MRAYVRAYMRPCARMHVRPRRRTRAYTRVRACEGLWRRLHYVVLSTSHPCGWGSPENWGFLVLWLRCGPEMPLYGP